MHAECSPAAIQRRYLSSMPVLRAGFASRPLCPAGGFSLVTERDHHVVGIATVAPADDDDAGRRRSDSSSSTGCSVKASVRHCSATASRRGFTALVPLVHPDNRAVLPMVNAAGLRARINTSEGLTRVWISLTPSRRNERVRSA